MQCFKTILLDICRFHVPWTGENAKFFEFCERSQYKPTEQVKVAFSTQNLQKKKDDQLFFGTVNPTSKTYCHNFFGFTGDIAGYTSVPQVISITTLANIKAYTASLLGTTGNYVAMEYFGNEEPFFPTTYEEFAKQPQGPDYIEVNFDEDGNIIV
jgi:hypothetical protein